MFRPRPKGLPQRMIKTFPEGISAGMYYALYNLILLILSPILLIFAVGRDLQRIGAEFMPQRWGMFRLREGQGPVVWIHAASVGETMAAAPIVKCLRDLRPNVRIVFSNITATGHETAVRVIPNADYFYLPYEFPPAVRRALRTIHPLVCVTVESELWPNLVHLSRKAGASPVVVNGHISDRTFKRVLWPPVRPIFRWMLSELDGYYAQTELDAERAVSLGALPSGVEVIGNSKFDGALVDDPPAHAMAAELGFPVDCPTLVAGSTHPVEDEAVLDAFVSIRTAVPDARLIIAPRHLERAPALREALEKRGLRAVFRSERRSMAGAPAGNGSGLLPSSTVMDASVLVLDTLGELRQTYALATVAFVGGTFVPVGGHDLLQPLAKGKPVLFGPHTHKCREIADAVLSQDAGCRVADAKELANECIRLMQDESRAGQMGSAGLKMIQASQGASLRYAERIVRLLERK